MYVSGRSASLWDTVTAQCSLTELSEIKRIIGESLIEQTCELHTEAISLREILGSHDTGGPTLNRATIHHVSQSVSELVKHVKSNKVSQTAEVITKIREALHLEGTRLSAEIALLQEQLDERANVVNATADDAQGHEGRPSSSSNTRLNSAQRFRQMITSSRRCDDSCHNLNN